MILQAPAATPHGNSHNSVAMMKPAIMMGFRVSHVLNELCTAAMDAAYKPDKVNHNICSCPTFPDIVDCPAANTGD
jgi:hypothetical protein